MLLLSKKVGERIENLPIHVFKTTAIVLPLESRSTEEIKNAILFIIIIHMYCRYKKTKSPPLLVITSNAVTDNYSSHFFYFIVPRTYTHFKSV